jgi:hypothetical protein
MAHYGSVRAPVACRASVLMFMVATLWTAPTYAQRGSPHPASAEVQVIAEGWASLRQGELQQALQIAERAIAEYPRSAAAVALAVEADIQRGGALAGLAPYERWLAARRVDDPYVLRRIALGHLDRAAAEKQHPARLEAATALAADGSAEARAELARAAANGGAAETQLLASLGDARAVRELAAQARAPDGSKSRVIAALGDSRSTDAVPPLMELLGDSREEYRAAAADALGKLGASAAVPKLRPLLNDPAFPVRVAAASALYRLEDYAGVNLLNELMSSEHGTVRLAAVEAMAVRPPAGWVTVVRDLTNHEEAVVQLGAARLLAPYEPDVAAEVLARLGKSDNPAIREEAGRNYIRHLAADFASLRRFLRSPDVVTSVRAAARILELTR